LQAIEADLPVLDAYPDDRTNILVVGRLAPNKGHVRSLEAFAAYHREYNCHSRLIFVGKDDPRLRPYSRALRARVTDLGLEEDVVFTGGVGERALKSYYLLAHVFLITSDHEGFCVPLVEAMAMKLPIVALSTTAVGETLGDGGLAWEEPDPGLLAESLHSLASDDWAGACLGLAAWSRYHRHFTNEVIGRRFLAAVSEVL
jgi:glycosyltransferase involved in cell wall biosynthesis